MKLKLMSWYGLLAYVGIVVVAFFIVGIFADDPSPKSPYSSAALSFLEESGQIPEGSGASEGVVGISEEEFVGQSPSSGGGGGSGSDGGSGGSGGSCSLESIAYSIGDKKIFEECEEFSGSACIEKSLTCQVRLENLHDSVSGTFTGFISFFREGSSEEVVDATAFEEFVAADSFKLINSTVTLTGSLAEEEIVCFYQTLSTPKEEVC